MNTRALCLFAFPATLLALVAACTATPTGSGDTQPSPDGGAGADSGGGVVVAKPGQLALSVQKARRGGSAGKKGLVELAVTLSNGEGGVNALSNPALFKLKGSDGLAVSGGAMPASYIQGTACNPAGEVTAGAAYSCVLTFQLADNAEAVELSYVNPADKRSPKAAVSVEACTACGAKCTYLDTDKENCGQCGVPTPAEALCIGGKPVCARTTETFCDGTCIDVKTDAKNCGACGAAVGYLQVCRDGTAVCKDPSSQRMCGRGCADITQDEENCGECGRKCALSNVTGSGIYNIYCSFGTRPTHPCTYSFCVASTSDCTDAYCAGRGAKTKVSVQYSGTCPVGQDYMCNCSDDAS